jgi:hypothetical protein
MTEGALRGSAARSEWRQLLGASTAAKLEDQIVVRSADVDLAASLRVRISSACGSQAWNGCDFLFACSEGTTQEGSESLAENPFMVTTTTMFTKRCLGGFAV